MISFTAQELQLVAAERIAGTAEADTRAAGIEHSLVQPQMIFVHQKLV